MADENHNDADDQQRADRAPHPKEAPGASMGLLPPGTQPDFTLSTVDDTRAGAAGAPPTPPSYPVDLLGDPVLYEQGNEPVRIAVMTEAQQKYGNRAVQRFLQRRAAGSARSLPVQRDDSSLPPTPDVTLPTPSLLQPIDLLKQYGLFGDFQYKLDPRTEVQMRQYVQLRADIAPVQAAAQSFKPSAAPAAPAGQPAPGGGTTPSGQGQQPAQTPQTPPAASPGPSSTPSAPGAGPDKPKAATPGQLLSAVLASEPFKSGWEGLQKRVISQATIDWSRLKKGERIALVSTTVAIGVGAIAGMTLTDDPTARQFVLGQLNGQTLPVPGADWLKLEMNTAGDSLMFGMHADVGALLGPRFGFKPSSPSPIGGPPKPQPLPIPFPSTTPTQRTKAGQPSAPPPQVRGQHGAVPLQRLAVQRDTPAVTTGAANAKENFKITNDTFDVEATTLADAAAVIESMGDAADTTWNPVYNLKQDGGKVTEVEINVDINIVMPNWPGASKLKGAAKTEWNRAYKALSDHEQGHVDLVKQKLAGVAAKMVGKTKAAADAIFQKAVAELSKESKAYDKKTDHGRKTGTIIDVDAGSKPAQPVRASLQRAAPEEGSDRLDSPTDIKHSSEPSASLPPTKMPLQRLAVQRDGDSGSDGAGGAPPSRDQGAEGAGGTPNPPSPASPAPQADDTTTKVPVPDVTLFDRVSLPTPKPWKPQPVTAELVPAVVVNVPGVGPVQIRVLGEMTAGASLDAGIGPGVVRNIVLDVPAGETHRGPLNKFRGQGELAAPADVTAQVDSSASVTGEVMPMVLKGASGNLKGQLAGQALAPENATFENLINLEYQAERLTLNPNGQAKLTFRFALEFMVNAEVVAFLKIESQESSSEADSPPGTDSEPGESPVPGTPPTMPSTPQPGIPRIPGLPAPPTLPPAAGGPGGGGSPVSVEAEIWRRTWEVASWQWSHILEVAATLTINAKDGNVGYPKVEWEAKEDFPLEELLKAFGNLPSVEMISPMKARGESSDPAKSRKPCPVNAGDTFLVKNNNKWYRGQITKVPDPNGSEPTQYVMYKVEFVQGTVTGTVELTTFIADFESRKRFAPFDSGALRETLQPLLDDPLLHRGPYAVESIPSRGPVNKPGERDAIQAIGNKYGCHHGGKAHGGPFVADHIPPTELVNHGLMSGSQQLYPQCYPCSSSQGGKINAILRMWLGKIPQAQP